MTTTSEYDALVTRKQAELRGEINLKNGLSLQFEPGKEVTITSVPIIEFPPEVLDHPLMQSALEPKRKRGRPKGSKNKPKDKK